MVDREKVIRGTEICLSGGLPKRCIECPYHHDGCDRQRMIDTLEVLKEQPKWISVKDRLPDDASDVLAYYDDGTESRIIPVNYYKRRWYDCVFNRSIDDLETGFIGYWMSLPEPPQEGVKRE